MLERNMGDNIIELEREERKQLLKWGKSGINLGKLKLTMKLNNSRLTRGKSQSLRNSQC